MSVSKKEILKTLEKVFDPEIPESIISLGIVSEKDIKIKDGEIIVEFTPTVPYCPMGAIIGFLIKYALKQKKINAKVFVKKGTHILENEINLQLNDDNTFEKMIVKLKENGV
ncbi:MAG: iron-sulfur cluster assembly protein, partial [archaeon]